MSAAPEIVKAATAPAPVARRPVTPAPADPPEVPALAQTFARRLTNEWLPRAGWTISRTGRPGLVGIALLVAAALFFFSTHLQMVGEVEALRAELASTQVRTRTVAEENVKDPASAKRTLPARTEIPAILRQLFDKATQARLAVDTGKYEINASGSGSIVRYQITFPVTGPYPQIRAFIDSTLSTMPAVGLGDLILDRKAISDGNVDAQIRLTVYTLATGEPPELASAAVPGKHPSPRASKARRSSEPLVSSNPADALFAQHSWYVLPPAPKPAPPPPPPAPTAPPFPYTFVGSLTPVGKPPVFFLSHGDRVIDAHVGDRIDGVYQFESANGGQLVFVYLPLNVRHTLSAGASQ